MSNQIQNPNAKNLSRKSGNLLIFQSFIFSIILSGFIFAIPAFAFTIGKSTAPANSSLMNGLVGWWMFDGKDVSGNSLMDSSGYGNTGTRFDTAVGSAPAAGIGPKVYTGKLGQGLWFDGGSDFVSTTNASSLLVNTTTLSAWVRRSETGRMDSIMSKGSYALKIGPDDKPFFEMATGSEAIVGLGNFTAGTDNYALVVYNGKLYAGSSAGRVWRYDGGATWTDVDVSISGIVYTLAVYNGQLYAGAAAGRVWRYDGGATWTDVDASITGNVVALAVYNGQLYAGGASGYVWRYDGGTTWTDVDASLSAGTVYTLAVYNGQLYAGSASGYVWRYDGGTTWTDVDASLGNAVYSLAVYNGRLYAGGAGGYVWRYEGGTTWTDVDASLGGTVRALAVYNGKLYAGSGSGYVWRYDGGATWTDVDSILDSPPSYNSLVVYDGKLFINTNNSATNDVGSLGAGKAVYANTTVSSSQWAHIAGSFDGTQMKIYVNGKLDNTTTTDAGSVVYSTNTTQLYVGSSLGSSGAGIGEENFYGIIDEARVYNRALTKTEIQQLYRMGAGNKVSKTPTPVNSWATDGLVGWWTFDGKDVSGNSLMDSSGYGNTGARFDTAVGAAPAAGIGPKIYTVGKLGQALTFNGNGNFVSTTDSNSLDLTAATTLSAWVRRSENSRMDSIMSKGSYALKIGPDDKPFFEMATGSPAFVGLGSITGVTTVSSSAVYNGKLYIGTDAGYVWRYDGGTTWTDVDSNIGGGVKALAVYNGKLYAGTAGEAGAKVWRYDGGAAWTSVDASFTSDVEALAVFKNALYGGDINAPVRRYDGVGVWPDIDNSANFGVFAFAVYNGNFYSGRNDSVFGNVLRYDGGVAWTDVEGTPMAGGVYAFAVYDGRLYAGSNGGYVYRYDGADTWTDVDASIGGSVKALAVYNGKLYAGSSDGNVWRYDGGSSWTSVGATGGAVKTLTVYDGKLYVGAHNDAANDVYVFGAGTAVYATTTVSSSQWAHLAGTYDGATAKIYVNGKLDNAATTAMVVSAENNTLPLLIGSSWGSSGAGFGEENFNGLIDDARVYNKVLSASEIKSFYQQGASSKVAVAPAAAVKGTGLARGLVGYWTFDGKDTGPAYTMDKSGSNNTGARNGGTQSAIGKIGQAVKFDGGSAYLNMGNPSGLNIGANNYSFSLWMKRASITGSVERLLIKREAGLKWYDVYMETDGNVYTTLAVNFPTVNYSSAFGPSAITNTAWHHVVVVVNRSSNGTVYIDGVAGAPASFSENAGDVSPTANFYVGVYGIDFTVPSQQFFNGSIDDVRVYNRALTKAEIQQLYQMGR